jgi:hypothetical protein
MNAYCRLSERRDEATFIERHFPYSQFRGRVSRLEDHAKKLLKDTMVNFQYSSSFDLNLILLVVSQKTTVPFVGDIDYEPRDRRSSSKDPDPVSTSSAPSLDVGSA